VYGYRNDTEHAFEWLERTYAQRDPGITYMKMDPFLRNLHDDPRWQPFLEKMGLADSEVSAGPPAPTSDVALDD
jgi:hypothetical protein